MLTANTYMSHSKPRAEDTATSLWDLPQGDKCRVQSIQKGLDKDYRKRLRDLGFHPGEIVTCVMAPRMGAPRLYRVHNSIYSLDDQIARLIHISHQGIE